MAKKKKRRDNPTPTNSPAPRKTASDGDELAVTPSPRRTPRKQTPSPGKDRDWTQGVVYSHVEFEKSGLAYLRPGTCFLTSVFMQHAGLRINQPVLLRAQDTPDQLSTVEERIQAQETEPGSEQQADSDTNPTTQHQCEPIVLFAFPSASKLQHVNAVGLTGSQRLSCGVDLNSPVTVTPLTETIKEATLINVELPNTPEAEAIPFDIFQRAVTSRLIQTTIRQGQVLSIPVQGRQHRVRLTTVQGTTAKAETLADESVPGATIPDDTEPGHVSEGGSTTRTVRFFECTSGTKIDVQTARTGVVMTKRRKNPSRVGGLSKQMALIQQTLETRLLKPEIFTNFGLKPPRGILLHGPPGTGKTLLARTVADKLPEVQTLHVNGPEVMSKYFGETESQLRDLFSRAAELSPCVLLIDEIDAICPARDSAPSDLEKRVVATLLALMDGIDSTRGGNAGAVFVIGTTNRLESIDPALRRPGRFDREVEIGIPNADQRYDILSSLLISQAVTAQPEQLREIANQTHGFVGADIAALCKEAALESCKRAISECESKNESVELSSLAISSEDLKLAMTMVKPSAMREIIIDVPHVKWTDIGGQHETKQQLREAVEWPQKHPEAFKRMGISQPKGVLLYGPPGCSKTMLAKALATESRLNFIAVKGPELFSKWVGDSERAVKEVFRKARAAAPSIIFFDEIDALAVQRGASNTGGSGVGDRVLSQLLSEMDGVEGLTNVTVVAATNRPDLIDPALLRPGRMDRKIYVGLPDLEARKEILRIQMNSIPHEDAEVSPTIAVTSDKPQLSVDELANKTEGYSGAEIVALCREAALVAMTEDPEHAEVVTKKNFDAAQEQFTRSTTKQTMQFYEDYNAKLES